MIPGPVPPESAWQQWHLTVSTQAKDKISKSGKLAQVDADILVDFPIL